MAQTVTIEGMEQLEKKLRKVRDKGRIKTALKAAGVHIKGKVDTYPPATAANASKGPGGRWYQRGYGPRWRRVDGSVGGRKTSETLGRRWTIKQRGRETIVGNNVSYGIYVQGDEQASFHGKRGWKTIEQVADEESATVVKFMKKEIDKALGR